MSINIPEGFGSFAMEVTGNAGTAPYIFTIGIAIDDAGSLVENANQVFFGYQEAFQSLTFDAFTFTRGILTVPAGDGAYGSVETDLDPWTGSASGDPGPVGMAVLVQKRTGLLGRAGRGRLFLPGLIGEGDVDIDGNISNSSVDLYQSAINDWVEFMVTDHAPINVNTNPMLLHSSNSLPPSAITSMVVQKKIGWIRKRLR